MFIAYVASNIGKKRSSKFNQVTLITDHRYGPYLKQWKSSEILILDDEVRDIEAFLISNKKLLRAKTLYLVVIGIYSFTTMVNADVCKMNKCDHSSMLHALQPIVYGKFNELVSQNVSEINENLNKARVHLLNGSNIAILPPLPISLMPLCDDHKLLHNLQDIFPNYMLVNSITSDFKSHYMFWMKNMTSLAWIRLSPHINCSNLQRSLDDDYYKLNEMSCSSADKPSYDKWKDLVKIIFNMALSSDSNTNKLSEIEIMPHPKFSSYESNLKGRPLEVLKNSSQNISKSLSSCDKDCNEVAYDHLVLIGKPDSLKLLDGIKFCPVSQWYIDEDFKFETCIDLLRKEGLKKILFVFISDATMIGCKNQSMECIKHKCKQQLSFIGKSRKFDSLDLTLKHSIITLKNIMSQIKNLCDIQSQIIVAPFTPGFYVHISNIILFHLKMHNLLDHQNGICFIRGYSMILWEDILKTFEIKWKGLSVKFSSKSFKEMEFIHEKKFSWKILPLLADSIAKVDSEIVSEWKKCVMSLILKGWSKTQPISAIESICSNITSNSSANIHQRPLLSNLIQVELNSEASYSERLPEIFSNESSLSTASLTPPPSNLRPLLEDTKNSLHDCLDDTCSTINSVLDDVILFAKQILNSKQLLKTCSKKYENAFIIGKLEILSKLSNLNINSTFINEDFSKFEMKCLMDQIYLKSGKCIENFVCCFLFDLSIITETIGELSECLNRGCHKPLVAYILKANSENDTQNTDEVDVFIANHLQNIKLFIDKLSKVIPVVILPLYPARIYCCDRASSTDDHQICHHMAALGCTLVQGPKCLWIKVFQSLSHSWNNLMKRYNLELDNYNYFHTYMSRKQNVFSFVDNKMNITKNWSEPIVWKAFIDTFLLSVLLKKVYPKDVSIKTATPSYKKVDVSIMRVAPSIPFGFCEELFKSIDEKVVIIQEKGIYILKDMILDRAVLFAKKLSEFRIGDTILVAAVQDNDFNEDEEISLMQDLYISSKIENVYRKWKDSIIDNISKNLNTVPDVRTMKSTPCEKGYSCKGLKLCTHYHSPTDKRRNPMLYKYLMQFCLKPQTIDGLCDNGELCLRSHNYYEEKFHPEEFQAKLCSSGLSSDACNRQKLCMHAHKDSPEMFYVSEWVDLIVTDISNTINVFAGAIRGVSKLKDISLYNFRILLISSSSEFLDTAVKASSCLLKDFKLKVSFLQSGMTDAADSCEVIVGNPSLFIGLNPNIFLEMSGAIIVDDIHSILKDSKESESFFQLFKNITSSSYSIMLNKVFVCDSYDTDATNAILRITGSRLKHLHIENPYKTDIRIKNLSCQSSSSKQIDKKISDVSRKIRRRKILHDAKVKLTISDSQSVSKPIHYQNMTESNCNLKSPFHKSRSRSKSLEQDREVVENIEHKISLIRNADVKPGLSESEQSIDNGRMHSQTTFISVRAKPAESYKEDQLTDADKTGLRFHDTNNKSQLKRNTNGTPLEVMSKYKYNSKTDISYQSQDQEESCSKQKRSRSKSIDRTTKKSCSKPINKHATSPKKIQKRSPMHCSRSRSVDKNNRCRSKSINRHTTSPRRIQKRSPLHRSRSRSVDKNNRCRSKSINRHATSPKRIQKGSPLHRSRSRSVDRNDWSRSKSLNRHATSPLRMQKRSPLHRSRSRSVDKNNRCRSKSINRHATSPKRIQKGSPLHRSRSRSVDRNDRSRSKSLNRHATSHLRMQKRSPLHRSRSRSNSLELDKTSMLKILQRCTSQSLSKKPYKRSRMEKQDNKVVQGSFTQINTTESISVKSESSAEQKLLNENRSESKLEKFRRSASVLKVLPKNEKTLLSGTIPYWKEPQETNFEASARSLENKNMVTLRDSDFKLIKADGIEQNWPKSPFPASGKPKASFDQASSNPNCSHNDRELLGDFLIRKKLGTKLYEAYKTAVQKLHGAFEMEYTVYKNIPEVHPNYSDYYATFTAKFIAQHGDSKDEIKEKLWKLFWDSKYDEIKEDDWKLKQRNLLKSFEQKVNMESASLFNPILSVTQKVLNSSFVFKEALTLIEQLCENIVFLGPSVKSMIEMCRSLGTTTKEAYKVFTESENVELVKLLMERFKTKSLEGPNDTRQLFVKATEWIPKILEEAKAGQRTNIEDVTININSIAKISAGKGTDFTLNLIKIALAYEGFPDPPLEVVNEYFMKVCRVHFEASISRPK